MLAHAEKTNPSPLLPRSALPLHPRFKAVSQEGVSLERLVLDHVRRLYAYKCIDVHTCMHAYTFMYRCMHVYVCTYTYNACCSWVHIMLHCIASFCIPPLYCAVSQGMCIKSSSIAQKHMFNTMCSQQHSIILPQSCMMRQSMATHLAYCNAR